MPSAPKLVPRSALATRGGGEFDQQIIAVAALRRVDPFLARCGRTASGGAQPRTDLVWALSGTPQPDPERRQLS